MSSDTPTDPTRRIASSDDLEVSAYLEIAQEKVGRGSPEQSSHDPQRESLLIIDFMLGKEANTNIQENHEEQTEKERYYA